VAGAGGDVRDSHRRLLHPDDIRRKA